MKGEHDETDSSGDFNVSVLVNESEFSSEGNGKAGGGKTISDL